jgi:Domain of unknown function (DUF4375)
MVNFPAAGTGCLGRRAGLLVAALAVLIAGYFPAAVRAAEPVADQSVTVAKDAAASDKPEDIVASNVNFVNALLAEHLRLEEISRDALLSYYVDYYLAEVENGGFSQFVYNSGWAPATIGFVREGLSALKAEQHLKLFNESAAILDRMGPDKLKAFLDSKYFGTNEERDALDEHNTRFYELSKTEDLLALNAVWLRGRPGLRTMTVPGLEAEVERRAAALPDREERKRAALAAEPRSMKLMRALASKAGQTFAFATAGDPTQDYNGKKLIAWHFMTDKGHFYMIDADGKAIMIDAGTNKPVAEMDAP